MKLRDQRNCVKSCGEGESFDLLTDKCVKTQTTKSSSEEQKTSSEGTESQAASNNNLPSGNQGNDTESVKLCPSYFEPNENDTCVPTDNGWLIIAAAILISIIGIVVIVLLARK